MTIRRSTPTTNFTALSNTVLTARISAEALGVWVYLLSKPEDWVVRPTELRSHFPKMGRDRLQRIFRELQDHGVLERVAIRDTLGQVRQWDFVVTDVQVPENPVVVDGRKAGENSDGIQMPENPAHGKPTCGKPGPLQKTDSLQKTDKNKRGRSTATKAWAEALTLIEKSGTDSARSRCTDPVTQQVVKAMGGWKKLGSCPNNYELSRLREQFVQAYRERAA